MVQLLVTVHTITVDHRDLRIKKMLHVKINNTKFQFDVKLLLGKGGENIHVQHNTISYLQLYKFVAFSDLTTSHISESLHPWGSGALPTNDYQATVQEFQTLPHSLMTTHRCSTFKIKKRIRKKCSLGRTSSLFYL